MFEVPSNRFRALPQLLAPDLSGAWRRFVASSWSFSLGTAEFLSSVNCNGCSNCHVSLACTMRSQCYTIAGEVGADSDFRLRCIYRIHFCMRIFQILQFFHGIYTPGSTKIAMENGPFEDVPKHETYSIAMLFVRG